jgi:NitT/TauT family transport system ATP-binding protein
LAPGPPKLELRGVSKRFESAGREVLALEDVRLRVAEGEFVCLVGPSGCGKSTLLNLVAGLEFPDRGEVLVDGAPVAGPGPERTVLFQDAALFPWLSAIGNVRFGLRLRAEVPKAEREERARALLERVGLGEFLHASVHELSGGMRQRVALARALTAEPTILLMDEPFAALDALTREQFYGDLQRLWQRSRRTIVLVTHNVREAVCLGDRVVLLSARPGRVCEEFGVDLPRPRDFNQVEIAEVAGRILRTLKSHLAREDGGPEPAAP